MARRSGFLNYVKAAFTWHWNLLFVGAGLALTYLSGQPDVVLPLLLAAEISYLGLLTTRPRFQKAIDARMNDRGRSTVDDQQLLKQIRQQLKPEAWGRFENLRDRCVALSNLAQQIRGPQPSEPGRMHDMQTESLERLLWMFLKLIYSQDAMQRFLRGTNRNQLSVQLAATQKDLDEAREAKRSDKLVRSLEDKLETLKQRVANYDRAAENLEFLAAEIDRIEQKVNAISEMSISTRETADVSAQVDGIAEGVAVTEEAIRKLDVAPLFERESAPRLLSQTD